MESIALVKLERRSWWNAGRDNLLKELWSQGESASDIARTINERTGSQLTRCAVIGRVHRTKLEARGRGFNPIVASRSAIRKAALRKEPRIKVAKVRQFTEPETPYHFLGIPFLDLQDNQCRYPSGEPMLFCGQPRIEDSSYCARCHQVCYSRHQAAPAPLSARRFSPFRSSFRAA